MTKKTIKLPKGVDGFSEDKDRAKLIRDSELMPALAANEYVILDFSNMKTSTQSFVHALLRAALRRYREGTLSRIEFKNCAPQIRSLVHLVVDYSLGGFKEVEKDKKGESAAPRRRATRVKKSVKRRTQR